MSGSTRHSAVIVSPHIALLEPLVEDGGFAVVGAADTALNGERLVAHFQPHVIVIENDLPGGEVATAVATMRSASPLSRIVLVVNEHRAESDTSTLGTTAIVSREDLVLLAQRLHEVDEVIDLRGRRERRSGHDRRIDQDWSKVGWQRRQSIRRAEDRAAITAHPAGKAGA